MNLSYQFGISGIVISIVVIVNFFIRKSIKSRITRSFIEMMFITLVSTILEVVINGFFSNHIGNSMLMYHLVISYYALLLTLPTLYIYCLIYFAWKNYTFPMKTFVRIFVPYTIVLLLLITTPFTGLVFTISPKLEYTRGPLFFIFYIETAIYIIAAFLITLSERSSYSDREKVLICFFLIFVGTALIIQSLKWNSGFIGFMVSISMLFMTLLLDNPLDYFEKVTKLYNKKGFQTVTENLLRKKRNFCVIGIKFVGIQNLMQTIGYDNLNDLLRNIADYIRSMVPESKIAKISDSKYTIICNKENKAKLLQALQTRFQLPFMINQLSVLVSAIFTTVNCPEDADNFNNLFEMMIFTLENNTNAPAGTIIKADKQVLEKTRRKNDVLQILKKAVYDNGFEVYYQPIYSVEKARYTTAEALIRLKSSEIGYIGPDEFIPLAEQNGLILQIGEFVFTDVCRFIMQEKLWEKGIEYIHVNLSVVQFMQDKLYDRLFQIMNNFGLDYRMINLEVTETAAIVSSEALKCNMEKLIEKNVNFALDDYGMGFSNTSCLINYPFHTIKIDKSMVWSSMQNDKAKKILEQTISMVKALNMEVVAEGVETQEQAQALKDMGCDFFQGFLYSKPIKAEKFVELLK